MKKINLLLCSLAIAGLGFTSCSDDDNEVNNDDTKIAGTYHLEEVNTPAATDFDEDGDSNVDQTEESSCYDGGKIVLDSDNSFEYTITGILVTDGDSACATSRTVSGVYTVEPASNPSNALITLTYTDNDQTVVRQFTKIGKELSWSDNAIIPVYPDRDDEGAAVEVPGRREYVYVR